MVITVADGLVLSNLVRIFFLVSKISVFSLLTFPSLNNSTTASASIPIFSTQFAINAGEFAISIPSDITRFFNAAPSSPSLNSANRSEMIC